MTDSAVSKGAQANSENKLAMGAGGVQMATRFVATEECDALINAVEGRLDEGLIFCGSNAYRSEKIETVSEIMEEFS